MRIGVPTTVHSLQLCIATELDFTASYTFRYYSDVSSC